MSINKVIVTGNLTRDPELRQTPSGTHVLTLGLAVNDRWRNQSTGQWEDYANFLNCVLFGARAEALAKHLSKGTKVAIEGKLHWSQWEQDGQKRSKVDIYVDEIEFLSSRNSGGGSYEGGGYGSGGTGGAGGTGQSYQNAAPAPAALGESAPSANQIPAAPEITVYDDDIPF